MKRFKNILAIYNKEVGDEATLRRATSLARNNGARLTVAEVIDVSDSLDHSDVTALILAERMMDERREHLERLIVSIRHAGVEVSAAVLSGTAFLEITRAVLRERHDLVIMTAEVPGGLKNLMFGSTSMHLMRKCPCPVWVTKPGQPDTYAHILAAVDTFSSGEPHVSLNTLIMDLATSLARTDQGKLHIVHVWEMNRRDLETSSSEITQDMMKALLCRNQQAHQRGVDALVGTYEIKDVNHQIHLVRGEAKSSIPEVAARLQVDLLVMGTLCRTGVPGFFIGNTAETVLKQVDCSVLTVKPVGFVTPVTL